MNAGAGVGPNIPWSNAERFGEIAKFMAPSRAESSFFFTVSPDPVHNIATIQWSVPFTGYESYPAQLTEEWKTALKARIAAERVVRDSDGAVLHSLDESTLQREFSRNPVAEAAIFERLVHNVHAFLFRNTESSSGKTETAEKDERRGVLGLNKGWRVVKETNDRGCLHIHGLVALPLLPCISDSSFIEILIITFWFFPHIFIYSRTFIPVGKSFMAFTT